MTVKTNIADEIKQTKPFSSLEEEFLLTLKRTADVLFAKADELFRKHGISETQFNVLRILRGAGETGRRCGEIADRMVTRDPDITRLLDRMEKGGLIRRERDGKDRRVVITKITKQGLQLLAKLDKPINDLNVELLRGVSQRKLRELVEGLNEIRGVAAE